MIAYIADFFVEQVQGGAEISDNVVIEYLRERVGVSKVSSRDYKNFLAIGSAYKYVIVSNFATMPEDFKDHLTTEWKGKYIIIERDNKFIKNRNLALYENYEAPLEDVANRDFYQNAKKVFGLTTKHVQYMKRYLDPKNIESLGCTHFDEDSLQHLQRIVDNTSHIPKIERYAIMQGKRQDLAEYYCRTNGLPYVILPKMQYKQFLNELSKYEGFVFFSHAVESFCRVITEARIIGLKVISDDKNGVTYEKWFQENKGQALLNEIKDRTKISLEKILAEV